MITYAKSGTALRKGIVSMLAPTDKAAAAMDKYGIELKSADGTMKPFLEVIKMLRQKFKGLSKDQQIAAANTIFGKTAMSGMLAMINASETDFDKLTKATRNYSGAAEDMADVMMDNLVGQVTILKSALEGIRIEIGNVLLPFVKLAVAAFQKLADAFGALSPATKKIIIAFALVLASLGPILIAIGTLISIFGGIIIAIGGAVAAIAGIVAAFVAFSGIIIPILAVMAAMTIQFVAFAAIAASTIAIIASFVNSMFPLIDSFKLLRSILSGDMKNTMTILQEKFGLTAKEAEKLANRMKTVYQKAKEVVAVFRDNLGVFLQVIAKDIFGVTKSFDVFNKSTDETKGNTISMVESIVSGIEGIINYLHKLFDSFGLLPKKVSYANDETAKEYVRLNSIAEKSLDGLINTQSNYGKAYRSNNLEMLQQQQKDTSKALDDENKFVMDSLSKRKEKQIKILNEMSKDSKVINDSYKKDLMQSITETYTEQETLLNENTQKIKDIYTRSKDEKVALTSEEIMEITNLRGQYNMVSLSALDTSLQSQKQLLMESKAESVRISKEEALAVIQEANTKYATVIETAKKEKEEKIANALHMAETIPAFSKHEADLVIEEENKKYRETVSNAEKTKNETIALANEKTNNLLEKQEIENAGMSEKQSALKETILRVWESIKEEIPGMAADAGMSIAKAFMDAIKTKISNKISEVASEVKKVVDLMNPISLGSALLTGNAGGKKVNKHARGTNYAPGGISLLGEEGPELVNLPKGSKVFNANKTKQMLSKKLDTRGVTQGLSTNVIEKNMSTFENSKNASYRAGLTSDGKAMSNVSNNNITINITGNKISSDYDVNNIANKTIQRLQLAGIR